jgi:hypothetical protein
MARRKFKVAPLSGGFMLTSVVGFAASLIFIYGISQSWGMTLMIFFAIMFIASIISMTYNPLPEEAHKKKKVSE